MGEKKIRGEERQENKERQGNKGRRKIRMVEGKKNRENYSSKKKDYQRTYK